MRTTKDYEAHRNHLGQTRWRINHCWSIEVEDGIWDHDSESGTEFSSKDEAKHEARKGFVNYQSSLIKQHRVPIEYHVEVEMVRWAKDYWADDQIGRITDAVDEAPADSDHYDHTAFLYTEDGQWEDA